MIVRTTQIAEIFEVSVNSIRAWEIKGMPRAGHNAWDVKLCFDWWIENIYESSTPEVMDDDNPKHKYWVAKAEKEEINLAVLKKKLVKTDHIIEAWTWRINELSNTLGSLNLRLTPMLVGKSADEMRTIIYQELWKVRDNYVRNGSWESGGAEPESNGSDDEE